MANGALFHTTGGKINLSAGALDITNGAIATQDAGYDGVMTLNIGDVYSIRRQRRQRARTSSTAPSTLTITSGGYVNIG